MTLFPYLCCAVKRFLPYFLTVKLLEAMMNKSRGMCLSAPQLDGTDQVHSQPGIQFHGTVPSPSLLLVVSWSSHALGKAGMFALEYLHRHFLPEERWWQVRGLSLVNA